MYIKDFFINGFGIFSAQSVSDLENGLNIFYGRNEAGKTTCLEFLRTMLFGFPRMHATHYPPLRGGAHGGSVTLKSDSDGMLHIERRPGKNGLLLTDEHGLAVDAENLVRLMRGVTRQLYDSVYGFGLSELQELKTLSNPEVQNALYGASFGLGSRTVSQALAALQKEMQDIFRAGGSTQPMALRLKELERISLELKQKRAGIEQYNELASRHETLCGQSEILRHELETLEFRKRTLRRHLELRDTWKEHRELLHRLSLIPESNAPFATDSLERLERLCTEKETRALDLDRIAARIDRIREELKQTSPQPGILENESRIQALIEAKAALLKQIEERPQCAAELEQTRDALRDIAANLGPEFDAARFDSFDASVTALDRLDRFEQTLSDAENTFRAARDREKLQENALFEAVREKKQAEFLLAPEKKPDGNVLVTDKAQPLIHARGAIEHCARSIPDLRATVERGRAELTSLFYELGDGWTPHRVENFDVSTAFRARAGELEHALTRARRFYDDAALTHARAEYAWTELKERLAALKAGAAGAGFGARVLLPILSGCGAAAGVILLILGIVQKHGISLFLENRLAALIPGGMLFLAGLTGFGAWALLRASRNNSRETQLKENLEAARRELERAQIQLDEQEAALKKAEGNWMRCIGAICPEAGYSIETVLELIRKITALKGLNRELLPQAARLKELETTLAGYARDLECEPNPESVLKALDKLDAAFRNRQSALDNLSRANERLEHVRAALDKAGEETIAARRSLDELMNKWRQWLSELGLNMGLLPSSVRRIFAEVIRARELMNKARRLEQRLSDLTLAVHHCKDTLDSIPGCANYADENPVRRIDALAATLRAAKDAAVRQQEKTRALDEAVMLKEECIRRLEAAENALSRLLTSVGASNAEHFRAAFESWRRRKELAAQCEELRARLETGAGEGGLAALQATLNRFEENLNVEPETELHDLELACAESATRYQECLEEKGGVAAKLRDMELHGDEARLHKEKAELRAEIETLAKRWSALALARHFLLKAKAKYELERQPEVMREAGELFSSMTIGKYRGLVPTGADAQLAVLMASGSVVPCASLSRGAREQLFLAMRMAYIRDHGRHAEPLPVIMDDILVNFDPERAYRTAQSLANLAENQQVLFFTCHPRTAELLTAFKHKTFEIKDGVMHKKE